jgi:hypothetical protein
MQILKILMKNIMDLRIPSYQMAIALENIT